MNKTMNKIHIKKVIKILYGLQFSVKWKLQAVIIKGNILRYI